MAMSEHPYPVRYPQMRRHVPPRRGREFLGLSASVTTVGAILLYYTNALASQCRSIVKLHAVPAVCHGLPAAAQHLQAPLGVCVIASAAVFGIAFAWSLLWA
jgi:hypothetical protein